jgi:hypothetical protein
LTAIESGLIYEIPFTENGIVEVEFEDLAGNIGEPLEIKVDWIYENISIHNDFTVLRFTTNDGFIRFRLLNNHPTAPPKWLYFYIAEYDDYQLVSLIQIPIKLEDIFDAEFEIPQTGNELKFMLWEANSAKPVIGLR